MRGRYLFTRQTSRNGEGLPAAVAFMLDYTLCDGHWYLDAVLGRDP
jgi:hypothetical protein